MKITTKTFLDPDDYRSFYKIELQTEEKKLALDFHDGEPEDASLGRDFSDVYSIEELLKLAYTAGKNGEPINFESFEFETWDEFEEKWD